MPLSHRCAAPDPIRTPRRRCTTNAVFIPFIVKGTMSSLPLRQDRRGRVAIISAGLLALAIVLAGTVAGAFFYAAQAPRGTVLVTGAGTLPFESDEVKWTLT